MWRIEGNGLCPVVGMSVFYLRFLGGVGSLVWSSTFYPLKLCGFPCEVIYSVILSLFLPDWNLSIRGLRGESLFASSLSYHLELFSVLGSGKAAA